MKFNLAMGLLAIVFSAQSVFAQSAQELVQRDTQKFAKTFSRETRLIHYFFMPEGNKPGNSGFSWFESEENRSSFLGSHLASRAGEFWNLNNHNTFKINAGPGLYLAIDPNSSIEYGDTAITFDVPAGVKYISTVDTNLFKPDTIRALLQEGIITQSDLRTSSSSMSLEKGLNADALKNMVLQGNERFRQLMQTVFSNLDIQFIEYGYKSHQYGFCGNGRQTAIVFIGSRPNDQTSNDVRAVVDSRFQDTNMFASYMKGQFSGEQGLFVDLMLRYRQAVAEIRTQAYSRGKDGKKTVNWPLAKSIVRENLSAQEYSQMQSLSFECKPQP